MESFRNISFVWSWLLSLVTFVKYHIYSAIVNLLTVHTLLASASWYDSGFTIWDVAQGIILKIMYSRCSSPCQRYNHIEVILTLNNHYILI